MFEGYFNFTKIPFARDMPPDSLFITPQFKALQSRLAHTVKNRAFLVVTGDAGCGKTTATCNECEPQFTCSSRQSITPFYRRS
jgi:type II secretory pathway predicted ATPase ExeA